MRRLTLPLAFAACAPLVACAPSERLSAPGVARGNSPPTAATIVLLEPVPDACEWRRVDPVANVSEVLAKLPVNCDELTVAWNFDGTRAVIASRARIWEWSGTSAVEAPSRGGWIASVGYDLGGLVYASILEEEAIAPNHPAVDKVVRRKLFAHLDGGQWTAIDRIQHEWSPLSENRPVGSPMPRLRPFFGETVTDDVLLYRLETTFPWGAPLHDPALRRADTLAEQAAAVRALERMMRDSKAEPKSVPPWRAASVPGGVTIAQRGTEFFFVTHDRVFVPADLPPYFSDLYVRETFGLVATMDGGTAHLFDLRDGSPMWKSDTAIGVTFWPLPAAATASR